MPAPEEPPYLPEVHPGKVCALCNLGERSQLGQGELLRLVVPEDFRPEKLASRDLGEVENFIDTHNSDDKSPRACTSSGAAAGPAVTVRRQKNLANRRNPSLTNFLEPIEELSVVGYQEEPDVAILFEVMGHYYVHRNCALWSSGVTDVFSSIVCTAIVQSLARRCTHCSRFGAGLSCKVRLLIFIRMIINFQLSYLF